MHTCSSKVKCTHVILLILEAFLQVIPLTLQPVHQPVQLLGFVCQLCRIKATDFQWLDPLGQDSFLLGFQLLLGLLGDGALCIILQGRGTNCCQTGRPGPAPLSWVYVVKHSIVKLENLV